MTSFIKNLTETHIKKDNSEVLDTVPRKDTNDAIVYPESIKPETPKEGVAQPMHLGGITTVDPTKKINVPNEEGIKDSFAALGKIKPKSIPFAKQSRFTSSAANLAVMVMRRDDGTQIVDGFKPFTLIRDNQNNIAWTIFKKPQKRLGKLVLTNQKIDRLFNAELAMPTVNGYLSCHDAGSFAQIPFTQNKDLVSLFHKLDEQINRTTQGMVIANTEAARKKQKGSFLEKYGASIMLTLCMIMLAIALLELGGDISGFSNSINNLGSILSGLPSAVVGKVASSGGGPAAIVLGLLFP